MVLRGTQIHRCGPAGYTLHRDLIPSNDRARFPHNETVARTRTIAHIAPSSRPIIQLTVPFTFPANRLTRSYVIRAGRPAEVDRSPNGSR